MRKLLLVIVLLLGIMLSATTIEVLWMGWPQDQVMQVINAFKAENPGIDVDIQLVPFGQLFQTIEVRLAAGDGTPDVYIVDGPNTASYAARGYLLPLDEHFSEEEMSAWFDASIEEGSYHGKFYSVPYGTSSAGLFYNKAIFEEHGIPFPPENLEERLTWEEVAEIAKKLTKDTNADGLTDVWGLVIEQIDRPYLIFPMVQSLGAKVLSDDGLVWNIRRMLQYPDIDYGLSPFPYFEGGVAVTPTGSWHVGINSKTKKLEEALAFTKYITGKEAVIAWHKL
ncbi:MAG: ABC-type sugar transport system, periplasmic component, partial [Mesotoga infera]